jgi:5'-3' exonuclease
MNQQRSRRFRSAQDAATKEEERKAAIAEWEGASG